MFRFDMRLMNHISIYTVLISFYLLLSLIGGVDAFRCHLRWEFCSPPMPPSLGSRSCLYVLQLSWAKFYCSRAGLGVLGTQTSQVSALNQKYLANESDIRRKSEQTHRESENRGEGSMHSQFAAV